MTTYWPELTGATLTKWVEEEFSAFGIIVSLDDWQRYNLGSAFAKRLNDIKVTPSKNPLEDIANTIWTSDDYPEVVNMVKLLFTYKVAIGDDEACWEESGRVMFVVQYLSKFVLPEFDRATTPEDGLRLYRILATMAQEEDV